MMKYVTKIKAKMNIHSSRKSTMLFDGSYKSVYSGNGFDFENLREYIPGDNVRDIDWKASSRSRNILVKRYIAERKHNVLLVFDAGKKMEADSLMHQKKKEVALYAGGTLGYLAGKNGDQIGGLYCAGGMVSYYPLRPGLNHLEHILTMYDRQELAGGNEGLEKSLSYVVKNINKRMIVLVITDEAGVHSISEDTLKKVTCMNDVLFVTVSDVMLTDGTSYHMEKECYLPDYISGNKKLKKIEQETRQRVLAENEQKLTKDGIVSTQVHSEDDLGDKITELLERHRYASKC